VLELCEVIGIENKSHWYAITFDEDALSAFGNIRSEAALAIRHWLWVGSHTNIARLARLRPTSSALALIGIEFEN